MITHWENILFELWYIMDGLFQVESVPLATRSWGGMGFARVVLTPIFAKANANDTSKQIHFTCVEI